MTPVDMEGLVLGYGGISHRQIASGIAELAAVFADCAGAGGRGGRRGKAAPAEALP
jgi:hypothetical protein